MLQLRWWSIGLLERPDSTPPGDVAAVPVAGP
jgi:hypothetical protein